MAGEFKLIKEMYACTSSGIQISVIARSAFLGIILRFCEKEPKFVRNPISISSMLAVTEMKSPNSEVSTIAFLIFVSKNAETLLLASRVAPYLLLSSRSPDEGKKNDLQ